MYNKYSRKVSKRSSFVAQILYKLHYQYGVSTDIADNLSYGYGKLNDNGFWQYPLYFIK